MAAYRQVYDSRRLQADCQEPVSASELIRSAIQMMHVSEWDIFNIGFIINLNVALSITCVICILSHDQPRPASLIGRNVIT